MSLCSPRTNTPTAKGVAALKYYLERHSGEYRPNIPTLLRLTELVLNLSSFDLTSNSTFKEVVAMGTKMGQLYSCMADGYVENKMFRTYPGNKPILL